MLRLGAQGSLYPIRRAAAIPCYDARRTMDYEAEALAFLQTQLGPHAPNRLEHALTVHEEPLEGEGPTSLFRFEAAPDGGAPQRFWVAAGVTEPNYYPDWGLSADEMYSVHIGTRFMLVMEVAQAPPDQVPHDASEWFESFIRSVAPSARVSIVKPLAAFLVEAQFHVVVEAVVNDERIAVVGYEAPPGIYRNAHLPPQVLPRRHWGTLIRREAQAERLKAQFVPRKR